jgi:hypothetical protein
LAALEALAASRFDVVVTDVRMPRLDGIRLVQRLHESATYTPVVIFVSGFVDLPIPDALDLGVEAVCTLPLAAAACRWTSAGPSSPTTRSDSHSPSIMTDRFIWMDEACSVEANPFPAAVASALNFCT